LWTLIAGGYKVHRDYRSWREQQDLALKGGEVELVSTLHSSGECSSDRVAAVLEAINCVANPEEVSELEDCLEVDPPMVVCLQQNVTDAKGKVDTLETDKRERKRIRPRLYGNALKSLVEKAKLAFPVPKNNELQIQAINLFLHKECRKLNIRISDAARLIPQAVALAIIPSDQQIVAGQVAGLPEIQKRYLQRVWKHENPSLSTRVVNAIVTFVNK